MLTKVSKKLLEAFEMWMWQIMLKITWTEKVTRKRRWYMPMKLGAY